MGTQMLFFKIKYLLEEKMMIFKFWKTYSITKILKESQGPWEGVREIYKREFKILKRWILTGGTFYGKTADFTKLQFESEKVA